MAQVVSLPYVRCIRPLCTRPLAVVHSLYTPARCCTFTAHARSLSHIHCTWPLVVVHSLYTPARCRARPLAVVHSLQTPARCRTRSLARSLACSLSYTSPPRCRLLVVTAPLAGPPCLPSASFDIREYHFRRQCYGWRSLPRAAGFGLCILFVLTCDERGRPSNDG